MKLVPCTLSAFALIVLIASAPAAEPGDVPPPQTLMIQPGKLLLADDFASIHGAWKLAKGKWEVAGGKFRGAELTADMHGAVARRDVPMKDVVIQYSFKLDGARKTTLSLNAAKGHICRVLIDSKGFTVQKDDQDGKKGDDKAARLDTVEVELKPGQWHTLVVELRGPDILATLDGKLTVFGSHPAIDKAKANLGFTVAGESASFQNLRVWESAGVHKNWEATRAKLVEARKKQ
jgi:hypothetical protein